MVETTEKVEHTFFCHLFFILFTHTFVYIKYYYLLILYCLLSIRCIYMYVAHPPIHRIYIYFFLFFYLFYLGKFVSCVRSQYTLICVCVCVCWVDICICQTREKHKEENGRCHRVNTHLTTCHNIYGTLVAPQSNMQQTNENN